ncbi:MAG: orotidine-5'-phosphate decarboxylase [Gammaproteobacteria bacterium]|nr:orotidine-5'-phosphate decarboxylase [Gammaproteobacteria bacterium]
MSDKNPRIILALDFADEKPMLELVEQLQPSQCRLKVGKELFTRCGPDIVRQLVKRGFDVFLDLKFHDIPNTVAKACLAAADLGIWMLNVHALGGQRMLVSAREALDNIKNPPLLIAVTVLTSMDDDQLRAVGINVTAHDAANQLAALAHKEGMDGVVCSALEAKQMSTQFGENFCLVTPGIRLQDDALGDQMRVMTPAAAIKAGSHFLVIGRSITHAQNPLEKLLEINQTIAD